MQNQRCILQLQQQLLVGGMA